MTLQLSNHLANAIKKLGKENKILAVDLANSLKENIINQGGDSKGKSWEALKAKTKKYKTAGTRNKILVGRSRQLSKSIKGATNNNDIYVGTNVIYARTHNEGAQSRGIPQREFLFLGKTQESIINEYIKKVVS